MNRKTQGDFHRLVSLFTRSVGLWVISHAVKQLYSELYEQGSSKFTEEFQVPIGD